MLSARAQGSDERPATFYDVFRVGEFRAIYAASALSWIGDYIARAAITALVYQVTNSVVASAAAFAISYAPWLLGGSVLVSLADRYSYRSVMIWCDVARMLLMATVALPRLPIPVVLLLLLCSSLFSPPFEAARSATVPTILPGERYVVGLGILTATGQPMQVAGYLLGAALAAASPQLALLINAATFAVSAALVRFGIAWRPATLDRSRGSHLLQETIDGFRLVFASPALRSPVLLVFCGSVFAVVPEALAAAWAFDIAEASERGWAQGMIMGAVPLGSITGALLMTRLTTASTKNRLMRPLAIIVPLSLVPALFNLPPTGVAILAGICGFAIGGLVPLANGQFVRALPAPFRARAFGVVQGGLALLQGGSVLITGALATRLSVPLVVGLWSLCGVGLMTVLSLTWPAPNIFATAVSDAERSNAHADSPAAQKRSPVIGTAPRATVTPAPGTMEP